MFTKIGIFAVTLLVVLSAIFGLALFAFASFVALLQVQVLSSIPVPTVIKK